MKNFDAKDGEPNMKDLDKQSPLDTDLGVKVTERAETDGKQ